MISDLVKGTATDNAGNGYKFVYENDVTFDFDGSIAHVTPRATARGE